jgi:excisionase family DNA binding protein
MADYLTMEEVLSQLGITESKLRELVASGKLRSFRDQGSEKFRRPDVMKLKGAVQGQPTVVLPPKPETGKPKEPPAIKLEGEEEQQTAIPTIELSFDEEHAASSETMIPTIELSPEERAKEETVVPTEALADVGDEATDVATEEVALSDDDYVILEDRPAAAGAGVDVSDTDTDTSEDLATDTEPVAGERALEFEEEPTAHTAFTVVLGITTALMLAATYVFLSGVRPPMQQGLFNFFRDLGAKFGMGMS